MNTYTNTYRYIQETLNAEKKTGEAKQQTKNRFAESELTSSASLFTKPPGHHNGKKRSRSEASNRLEEPIGVSQQLTEEYGQVSTTVICLNMILTSPLLPIQDHSRNSSPNQEQTRLSANLKHELITTRATCEQPSRIRTQAISTSTANPSSQCPRPI